MGVTLNVQRAILNLLILICFEKTNHLLNAVGARKVTLVKKLIPDLNFGQEMESLFLCLQSEQI